MGDQRRRGGRSRSGRGGRIPRKGEGGGGNVQRDETFVSFPLEIGGPIRVVGTIDEAAVEAVFQELLELERRQSHQLGALSARLGEPALSRAQAQVDRHREALEQLAREVGVELARPADSADEAELAVVAAEQRSARLGWRRLQQAAAAAGDKRLDRVAKPILREKDLHADLLDGLQIQNASRRLFREPEY